MGYLDTLKALGNAISKTKDLKLLEKFISFQQSAMELFDENRKLKTELEILNRGKKLQGTIVYKDGVYFLRNNDKESGPYCTRCFDKDKNLIRLRMWENGYATCLECRSEFPYLYDKK